jgi:hypothetical protein
MSRTLRILTVPAIALLAASAAFAESWNFEATLSRAQEIPPPRPGLITAAEIEVSFDEGLSEARVHLTVQGGRNVTAAHFHCGRPGVTGPVAFGIFSPGPLTFDGGEAQGVLTNAAFTGQDCTPNVGRTVNTIAALAFAMRDGLIYANVHTTENGPGEVRGQLLPDDEGGDENGDDEDGDTGGGDDGDSDEDGNDWSPWWR